MAGRTPLLERLALHRPELRAWALYDWANSALITTVITAIWPIYFKTVAAAELDDTTSSARHSLATTIALCIVAVMSPLLGALADYRGIKKKCLALFACIGISATACLFLVERGDWLLGMVLFVLANIGASGSFVFYDALLPHVAREGEMDRLSTAGYALGYLGGGILLLLNLAWIQHPDWFGLPFGPDLDASASTLPTRLAFLSVAVWWALFSIPLFLRVKEPPRRLESDERPGQNPLRVAVTRLRETFTELRGYRQAFLLLVAFLVYNDGIMTIYRMATTIGADKGFATDIMIAAIVLVQFVGVPFAFGFGLLAERFGTKRMVLAGLAAYALITIYGYQMETEREFIALAVFVGMVQGGCQALSRSLFASMIPKHKSGEFFAFFAVGEKFAGIAGAALFTFLIVTTGGTESAIPFILAFFVVGGLLLTRVDVAAGQTTARAIDARVAATAVQDHP